MFQSPFGELKIGKGYANWCGYYSKGRVSVPFRGIKNRKVEKLGEAIGNELKFQSPFGELKIGKLRN